MRVNTLTHPFDFTASQSKISRSDRSDGRERRERSRTMIDARITRSHQTWPPATGTPPPLLACLGPPLDRSQKEKADTKQEHNALSHVTRDILQRCRDELSLGRSSGALNEMRQDGI